MENSSLELDLSFLRKEADAEKEAEMNAIEEAERKAQADSTYSRGSFLLPHHKVHFNAVSMYQTLKWIKENPARANREPEKIDEPDTASTSLSGPNKKKDEPDTASTSLSGPNKKKHEPDTASTSLSGPKKMKHEPDTASISLSGPNK